MNLSNKLLWSKIDVAREWEGEVKRNSTFEFYGAFCRAKNS